MFDLSGKIVLVTGALGLLGRNYVKALSSFGATPVILDLDKAKAENFAKEISENYGVNASGYCVDITDESMIRNNCKKIIEKYGKIDSLINNAANNPKIGKTQDNFSRLENFLVEDWNADIAVGLTGAFLCSKHYGKAISKNPEGGVIINISSDLGRIAPDQRIYEKPGLNPEDQPVKPVTYSVVKTGLIGLTRYLSTYWPDKVRCNALCPGGVNSDLPEDFVSKIGKLIPLNRMANENEYNGAIVFLVSDASSYMNGSVLTVDGGRSAW